MKVKKFYLIMSLLMVATMMFAVPAKRGLWKMLRLSDGTEVKAQLSGDERVHFWVSENGQRYVEQGEVYVPVSVEEIQARAMKSSKARRNISHRLKSPFKAEMGDRTHYLGTKKGLVILAQFTDVKFKTANNLAKYKRIMNEADVSFQTAELGRVDVGGGGTIAYLPAKYEMDVIDSGVAVLSMHAPWEVVSKADLYEAYKGYLAFLLDAGPSTRVPAL